MMDATCTEALYWTEQRGCPLTPAPAGGMQIILPSGKTIPVPLDVWRDYKATIRSGHYFIDFPNGEFERLRGEAVPGREWPRIGFEWIVAAVFVVVCVAIALNS